jgi:hypothetical protein
MSLYRLLRASRTISPQASVAFLQVEDNEDFWVIQVSVGGVTIVQTAAGEPDTVVKEAIRKIESMSQRLLQAVRDSQPPPKA